MRPPAKAGRPIILCCIEDNKGYLRLRQEILETNGYSVLAATTALEALAMLRGSPVSLVISDHLLETTTGTGLATQIREIKPLVPILLYAGAMPEHLGDVNCFLSKTAPVETFLAMVASLVARYLG